MTTIPNLNVVVQQTNTAIEAQNLRSQVQHALDGETVVHRQEDVKQTTVQKPGESEGMVLDKERSEGGRRRREMKKKQRKKKEKVNVEKGPEDTGRLLDTMA